MNIPVEYYISWFLSAVVYDEYGCEEKIRSVFPDFKVHMEGDEGETFFHGVVLDRKNSTAYAVHRGTDGATFWDNMKSWGNNIHNIFTGENGIGDGAEKLSKMWFDTFKPYLYDYNYWYHIGHSKAAMNCQATALMHCQNMSPVQEIYCYPFSTFPVFKDPAASEVRSFIDDGLLNMISTIMPGDPAGSDIFRDTLGGIDIVEPRQMPDLIDYKIGPADWVNHSPKMITAGLLVELAQSKTPDPDKNTKIELLGKTFQYCVN